MGGWALLCGVTFFLSWEKTPALCSVHIGVERQAWSSCSASCEGLWAVHSVSGPEPIPHWAGRVWNGDQMGRCFLIQHCDKPNLGISGSWDWGISPSWRTLSGP